MMQSLAFTLFTVYTIVVVPFAICKPTISIPTSCLSYLKDGVEKNGYYSIAFKNGETVTVYCDFTSEPGSAWTLVMSWAMENNNLPAFRTKALPDDAPVNDKSPNWTIYRLPNAKMAALKRQSTHWRATCSFENFGVDYKDYIRGKFTEFDISTYIGDGICWKVEHINIRGNIGYYTTAPFWQKQDSYLLHTDSTYKTCQYLGHLGAVASEDNFGYQGSTNPNFRCTSGPNATTQYWFGGYL